MAIVAKTMMTVPEQSFLLPQHLSWLPVPVGMVPSLYMGELRCRRAVDARAVLMTTRSSCFVSR